MLWLCYEQYNIFGNPKSDFDSKLELFYLYEFRTSSPIRLKIHLPPLLNIHYAVTPCNPIMPPHFHDVTLLILSIF